MIYLEVLSYTSMRTKSLSSELLLNYAASSRYKMNMYTILAVHVGTL